MGVQDLLGKLRRLDREKVNRRLAELREQVDFNVKVFLQTQERRLVGGLLEARRDREPRDLLEIPVVINSFNRLDSLRLLIDRLERTGLRNIFILDNASSYPPLLSFFQSTRHRVLQHGANRGPYGFWQSPFWKMFRNDYYVYTDPDVVPSDDCPDDYMKFFYDTLRADRALGKVGFGLRIDDLPAHAGTTKVIGWEKHHWDKPIGAAKLLYDAPIDTTFALYRPRARGGFWCPAYRSGAPYVARHMPWYADPARPTPEDEFYARTAAANVSHYVNSASTTHAGWGHDHPNPGMKKWWS